MKKVVLLTLAICLSGCATCDRHPKVCDAVFIGVGVAIISDLSARDWNRCSVIGKDTRVPPCARR